MLNATPGHLKSIDAIEDKMADDDWFYSRQIAKARIEEGSLLLIFDDGAKAWIKPGVNTRELLIVKVDAPRVST
jgi:hypothetical protein